MRRILALFATTAMMVAMLAMPASAQQTGLVNVNIEDTTIQVPIAVAANLCDIDVAVLAVQVEEDPTTTCEATAESRATPPAQAGGPR
jgi:uncharacterized protein YggE